MKIFPLAVALAASAILFAGAPLAATAGDASGDNGNGTEKTERSAENHWRVDLIPYLWAPTLNGTLNYDFPSIRHGIRPGIIAPIVERSGSLNVNVGPSSYLTHLNSAAMMEVVAQRGTGVLFTDVIYLNLSSSQTSIRNFSGPNGNIDLQTSTGASVHLSGTVWTIGGGYAILRGKWGTLQGFGGYRSAAIRTSLGWQFSGPFGILDTTGDAQRDVTLSDALAGVRGDVRLTRRLYIPYYFDIGAGNANSTWQGIGGFGYRFPTWSLLLVFRNLQYNTTPTNVIPNLRMGGIALGANVPL
ncbi:MAG TPA: hypothetical protein VMA36_02870 [Candidatus Limnocylindria bacterium]|jgi:hypothetical protein|nr:hypothetical protein [Candidatus Limnocylindria bacterium]